MKLISIDEFYKTLDRVANKGGKAPTRYVSPKEYELMQVMYQEGKLYPSGYVKEEFLKEYYTRLRSMK